MKSSKIHILENGLDLQILTKRKFFKNQIQRFEISQKNLALKSEKAQKGWMRIMNDQLMREKVRDLSFLNLEFHFERLIISKKLKFLKFFQSENSGPSRAILNWPKMTSPSTRHTLASKFFGLIFEIIRKTGYLKT